MPYPGTQGEGLRYVWNKKELSKMAQLVNQLGALSSSCNEVYKQKYKALIEVLSEESECQRTIIYVNNKRYFLKYE
jgi:hypothetical protein